MNHRQEPNPRAMASRDFEESRPAVPDASLARQALLKPLPLTERRRRLAGVSTAVLEGGEGSPVVLLHGPAANAAHWMRVIPGLSDRHRLIVPELPGHGASRIESGPLDVDQVLRWLGELIDQACGSRPVLVGHLLGGAIAARFAIAHGGEIDGLMLIDTFGLSEFRPAPELAGVLEQFALAPTTETHDDLWEYCAYDLPRMRRQMGDLWEPFEIYNVERARSQSQQEAISRLMQLFAMSKISSDDLARIAVPTSLIWGRHDLATPLEIAEAASARYGWPLYVIENANDDPLVEQPEAVLKAMARALANTDASEDRRPNQAQRHGEVLR